MIYWPRQVDIQAGAELLLTLGGNNLSRRCDVLPSVALLFHGCRLRTLVQSAGTGPAAYLFAVPADAERVFHHPGAVLPETGAGARQIDPTCLHVCIAQRVAVLSANLRLTK
jgi:hypothetical protein